MLEFEQDIDPEQNFLNSIKSQSSYFTDQQFNSEITHDQGISIIHFNSRNLYANFQNVKEYLWKFKNPFNIIAISETWINLERGDDFSLLGYNFHCVNRKDGKGGGVALFIDECLEYKVHENLCIVIDEVMECITIEVNIQREKNIIVNCLYRKPGSNIDIFIATMDKILSTMKNKINYLCGDFNIDLLNTNKYKKTDEFIELLYSKGMRPLITS